MSITVLVALLVCLIPTTIGALLSAIGIAGMDRLVQHNVLAMSGRAIEAAGDVTTLLLDKTGTITYGNRRASEFIAMPGVSEEEIRDAAARSSLADPTPECFPSELARSCPIFAASVNQPYDAFSTAPCSPTSPSTTKRTPRHPRRDHSQRPRSHQHRCPGRSHRRNKTAPPSGGAVFDFLFLRGRRWTQPEHVEAVGTAEFCVGTGETELRE
ncbi:hypothetical protein [Cutibacterium avidum]|uniref:hypothetical protein n=1 Tax=Cutibacterium avidum TaxID=33010 RepID=UPI001C338594|nr:hypothetical protein TPCV4_01060 [Cutibacterium avidum]